MTICASRVGHLVRPAVAQLDVHKVDRPDVVGKVRPLADDLGVVVVKSFASLVTGRKLYALFTP